jgi:hypothetical protein
MRYTVGVETRADERAGRATHESERERGSSKACDDPACIQSFAARIERVQAAAIQPSEGDLVDRHGLVERGIQGHARDLRWGPPLRYPPIVVVRSNSPSGIRPRSRGRTLHF